MSALPPARLLLGVRSKRDEQIEQFIRENPSRYKKLAPVSTDRDTRPVFEIFDRVPLGEMLGTYRRKKHVGSADE